MQKIEKSSTRQPKERKKIIERVSVKTAFVMILIGGASLFLVLYLIIVKMVYAPERASYDRFMMRKALHESRNNTAPAPEKKVPANASEEEKQSLLSIWENAKKLKVAGSDKDGNPIDINKEENICQVATLHIMADDKLTEHKVVDPNNIPIILKEGK